MFCAVRVNSATPTTEISDEALISNTISLTSDGSVKRNACGTRMRRSMSNGESPSMRAASRWPGRTLRKPPRKISAIYDAEHSDTALIAATTGDTLMPANGSR